ncbi:DUF2062 domain-containing protein [Hymenobacter sp. 102]|uniref:DUF2062 domain-containing protein n=1 Tax=Hymenobacter sp. 102 TaxID=3403152 RepID=UPI003CFA93FB
MQPSSSGSSNSAPAEAPHSWWRRRLVHPLLNLLKQGLTPHQLALTATVATAAGLIPVLGTTSLLTTAAALRLRLNVAAALLIAHLWSPVQLLLMIPLLTLGSRVWGSSGPALTLAKVEHLFTHNLLGAFHLLWHSILGALALWAGACCVLGPLLYFGLRPILTRVMRRQAAAPNEVAA